MKVRVDARTRVACTVEEAFRAFTTEIDAWWKRGPRYRFGEGREGTMVLEPRSGGRFFEQFEGHDEHDIGRVEVWEPPHRFVLAWSPRGEPRSSEVEVQFTPVDGATEVHLQHRGLEPAPGAEGTGLRSTALRNVRAVWWADVLGGLRAHAGGR